MCLLGVQVSPWASADYVASGERIVAASWSASSAAAYLDVGQRLGATAPAAWSHSWSELGTLINPIYLVISR